MRAYFQTLNDLFLTDLETHITLKLCNSNNHIIAIAQLGVHLVYTFLMPESYMTRDQN